MKIAGMVLCSNSQAAVILSNASRKLEILTEWFNASRKALFLMVILGAAVVAWRALPYGHLSHPLIYEWYVVHADPSYFKFAQELGVGYGKLSPVLDLLPTAIAQLFADPILYVWTNLMYFLAYASVLVLFLSGLTGEKHRRVKGFLMVSLLFLPIPWSYAWGMFPLRDLRPTSLFFLLLIAGLALIAHKRYGTGLMILSTSSVIQPTYALFILPALFLAAAVSLGPSSLIMFIRMHIRAVIASAAILLLLVVASVLAYRGYTANPIYLELSQSYDLMAATVWYNDWEANFFDPSIGRVVPFITSLMAGIFIFAGVKQAILKVELGILDWIVLSLVLVYGVAFLIFGFAFLKSPALLRLFLSLNTPKLIFPIALFFSLQMVQSVVQAIDHEKPSVGVVLGLLALSIVAVVSGYSIDSYLWRQLDLENLRIWIAGLSVLFLMTILLKHWEIELNLLPGLLALVLVFASGSALLLARQVFVNFQGQHSRDFSTILLTSRQIRAHEFDSRLEEIVPKNALVALTDGNEVDPPALHLKRNMPYVPLLEFYANDGNLREWFDRGITFGYLEVIPKQERPAVRLRIVTALLDGGKYYERSLSACDYVLAYKKLELATFSSFVLDEIPVEFAGEQPPLYLYRVVK